MTTKEYLSQVYLLSVRVRTKQQQAAELRNNISGVSGDKGAGYSYSKDARLNRSVDKPGRTDRTRDPGIGAEKRKNCQSDQSIEKPSTYPDFKDAVY